MVVILKKNTTQSWINYFKDLRDQGLYDDSNNIHVQALQFCYYCLIQSNLDEVKQTWNHHNIRSTKHTGSLQGRPDLMFFLPHNYSATNCGLGLDFQELEMSISMYAKKPPSFPCQNEFIDLANILMDEQNLQHPCSRSEAEDLYVFLVSAMETCDPSVFCHKVITVEKYIEIKVPVFKFSFFLPYFTSGS